MACGVIDNFMGRDDAFYSHVELRIQASVYWIRRGRLVTLFACKSDEIDVHDRARRHAALEGAYAGQGWIVPVLSASASASFNHAIQPIQETRVQRGICRCHR